MELRPCLPAAWRVPGQHFGLDIRIAGRPRSISIEPFGPGLVEVSIDGERHRLGWGDTVTLGEGGSIP
jgi:hypothetical protein